MTTEFKVGDKVMYPKSVGYRDDGVGVKITTVASVSGNVRFTCEDGTVWRMRDRCRWGESRDSWARSVNIRPYDADIAEQWAKREARAAALWAISARRWEDMPDSVLHEVCVILRTHDENKKKETSHA